MDDWVFLGLAWFACPGGGLVLLFYIDNLASVVS